MIGTVITSIISFISTNIDNIFVMMLLYAQVNEGLKKKHIVIGQYLGLAILVAVSILGAFGLNFIPQKYIGLLGLLPIALGVKEWVKYKKEKRIFHTANEEACTETVAINAINSEILNVMIVAVANGADNIGVYIPLFTGYSATQLIVTMTIFTLMMAFWCLLGSTITRFPRITSVIQKHKHIAVPVIFIGLGLYIFIKSGLLG